MTDALQQVLTSDPVVALAQLFVLLLARVTPIVSLTPLFGGAAVPRRMRTGLAILLAVGLMPTALGTPIGPASIIGFVALLVKEVLLGFAIGFGTIVFFGIVSSIGGLIDLSRGVTLSSLLDPLHGQQLSPLSVFFQLLLVVSFLTLGGYQLLIVALAESVVSLPPGELVAPHIATGVTAEAAIRLMSYLTLVTVKLASPVLVTLLLVDVSLGLINRIAPQLPVFFLGQETKAWLGLLVLLLSLGLFAQVLPGELFRMLHIAIDWFESMQR